MFSIGFYVTSPRSGGTAADVPYMDQAGLLLRRCVRLLTVAVVHISEGTKDAGMIEHDRPRCADC